MSKKLFILLSEILEIAPEEITDTTAPDNTPSWDSFNGLMIAVELEKTYDVKFTMDDILSVKKVGDIKNVLDKYNVKYEC
ncbi:MAG: hypothetical protein A3H70_03670 [Candidatus Komeilibacteria bacterium RIFCSPLOWO2_02_FULL_48_11]|uniref:Carrier domain-containing protein n=1 Tax=Candidatus Komeilibacteria bacterium RIFCSPLOWO2_02_FULL_48_11 TaxID=1798553 RepID=A0A1G2BNU6_9BACT|nr:MAG: hypothetical protein A3H70_03670 [Candidatus Komeilibacteria bacterium RIFCSPLOWO2_02_FULL_48_11]